MPRVKRGGTVPGVFAGLIRFVAWFTGVLVSLAVASGLINGVLNVPYVPLIITKMAGWIVIILTFFGAALVIIDRFTR
jgi:hypothetical protein